jgi:hypothetical protein
VPARDMGIDRKLHRGRKRGYRQVARRAQEHHIPRAWVLPYLTANHERLSLWSR